MPGKSEIMRVVREGLNSLEVNKGEGPEVWTKAVKTKLCEIGQNFRYQVRARDVDKADYGEWLYDVTWLEYEKNGRVLVHAPLVAECEWGLR